MTWSLTPQRALNLDSRLRGAAGRGRLGEATTREEEFVLGAMASARIHLCSAP